MNKKEMREIFRCLWLSGWDFLTLWLLPVGAAVVFGLMFAGLDCILGEEESILRETDVPVLLALILGVFSVMMECFGWVPQNAQLYLKMGATRRQMLAAVWGIGLAAGAVNLLTVWILKQIYSSLFFTAQSVSVVEYLPAAAWPLIWIAPMVFGTFFGAAGIYWRWSPVACTLSFFALVYTAGIPTDGSETRALITQWGIPAVIVLTAAALIGEIALFRRLEVRD